MCSSDLIGIGALLSQQGLIGGPTVATPTEPAPSAPAAPPPSALVEGGINFVSAAPDTTRVSVSCDGREADGSDGAGVAGPTAEKCAVKVVLKDRSRLYAEVTGATVGTWRCFEGGSKECVK